MSPWSFVGRVAELERIAGIGAGTRDRGVIFGGPPGAGKSRLLRQGVNGLDSNRLAVWSATATVATARLPLGALAHILPEDQPTNASPASLLRWAGDGLQRLAAGRTVIIAVDDAHLLDPLSATLLHYLARADRVTVLGTIRTGETAPDAVRALWMDDLVERIELAPFSVEETTELLTRVFDGPVHSASAERFWRLSAGNPLLLRELVVAARRAGEIGESYGVWRWTGRFPLTPTLTEVVDARIGPLTAAERTVLELVAFGEPLGLQLLAAATEPAGIEAVEERRLIEVVRDDRRVYVRLAHPLYREVIRRRCPVTRSRRLLAELADRVEQTGARRPDDLLRIAVWRLDSDTADDPAQLLAAARQAFAGYDIPLATRLARAAVHRGCGFEALELLATLLFVNGEPAEALAVLDEAHDGMRTPADRSRWMATRAITGYWGYDDEYARAALTTVDGVADPGHREWLRALESIMRLHHGEYAQAGELAEMVCRGEHASPAAQAVAAATIAYLDAISGEPARATRNLAAVRANADRWRPEAPCAQLGLDLATGTALLLAGDLPGMEMMANTESLRLAEEGEFRLGAGYLTLLRAQAARLRGALAEAHVCAGQACSVLNRVGVFTALACAERALIAGLRGDTVTASAAMADCERAEHRTLTVLYPHVELARAWVAVSRGELPTAVEVLHRLVDRLRADGLGGFEVLALYELVRLGHPDEAADRLGELARQVEGAIGPLAAWQARAAADQDGPSLLEVAEEWADRGMYLYAAEAAASALPPLRANRAPQTPVASDTLARLRRLCPDARTPALAIPQPTLTSRELQIAELAAAGVPSREIAERLYLSARTVDNHLLRVYAKLGVSGRAELPGALRTLPTEP